MCSVLREVLSSTHLIISTTRLLLVVPQHLPHCSYHHQEATYVLHVKHTYTTRRGARCWARLSSPVLVKGAAPNGRQQRLEPSRKLSTAVVKHRSPQTSKKRQHVPVAESFPQASSTSSSSIALRSGRPPARVTAGLSSHANKVRCDKLRGCAEGMVVTILSLVEIMPGEKGPACSGEVHGVKDEARNAHESIKTPK
jgi:hypothetical protein